jgi:hypothetical protein
LPKNARPAARIFLAVNYTITHLFFKRIPYFGHQVSAGGIDILGDNGAGRLGQADCSVGTEQLRTSTFFRE